MTDTQRAALVADVIRALEQRGVEREGAELKFRCFYPERHDQGDMHWSVYFNPTKAVWLCRVCGVSGGLLDLADRLGVPRPDREDVQPPRLEDSHPPFAVSIQGSSGAARTLGAAPARKRDSSARFAETTTVRESAQSTREGWRGT